MTQRIRHRFVICCPCSAPRSARQPRFFQTMSDLGNYCLFLRASTTRTRIMQTLCETSKMNLASCKPSRGLKTSTQQLFDKLHSAAPPPRANLCMILQKNTSWQFCDTSACQILGVLSQDPMLVTMLATLASRWILISHARACSSRFL